MKYSLFLKRLEQIKKESRLKDPEIIIVDRLEEDIDPSNPEEPTIELDWDNNLKEEVITIS